MRPYERKSTEVEMAIQRERDECIEEETREHGGFYATRKEQTRKLNVFRGGFIATYNLPAMGDEYLVELHTDCRRRVDMAEHDLSAVEAELGRRALGEFGAPIVSQPNIVLGEE